MSASNQPPRSVNFPSLLVSEDEGRGLSTPETRDDGSTVHSWIDSDFVPSWLRPFSLDATTRFTRTPDHLLRKTEELETGPGFCIGGTGWHFLDVPRDGDDDLSSFPSLKADLDALEMAFSDVQGAARLPPEDDEIGPGQPTGSSFSAEAGLIASFVSAELGTDIEGESAAEAAFDPVEWPEYEWAGIEDTAEMDAAMARPEGPAPEAAAFEPDLAASDGADEPEAGLSMEPVAEMVPAPEVICEDVSPDMTEIVSAEIEAEAGGAESAVAAGVVAWVADVIGPQMAASWAAERAEAGGPPAHLLALRQAIILGDAAFVHRSAADQDLHALPVLDEDDGTDAVMLSDWDQMLPESDEMEAAFARTHGVEADVAVMLSDFEPETERAAEPAVDIASPVAPDTAPGSETASVIAASMIPAETGWATEEPVAPVSDLPTVPVAETMADAPVSDAAMVDADEEAWEEAFLSSVCMTVQPVAEDANDVASAPLSASPLVEARDETGLLPAAVVEFSDVAMEVSAPSDAGDGDAEPVLAGAVLLDDAVDDVAEIDEDAFEDIVLMDAEAAGPLESAVIDAPAHAVVDEEPARQAAVAPVEPVSPVAPVAAALDIPSPAALAFTAPVTGAAFGWQPYQQSIGSDLLRFGAMAAPATVAAAALLTPAPAAGADAVAVPPLMAAPVGVSEEMAGQNVTSDGPVAEGEESALAEGASAYQLPDLELLSEPPLLEPDYELSEEALDQNSTALQQILRDFGVRGEIIDANPGPVVTLYEFEPAPGVKSSRVIGLADDIARSMSAISARVAVVPGRNVIGIELPNRRRDTVWLRELLASHEFSEARTKLGIGLGKTIGGEPVIADLARMPHLLVAGTTGSGKSVAINTMILSLLYQHTPEQCRLIMIDPKMLELSIYEGIPHLLTPVVTDPKKAIIALKWAVKEMEDRYRKMARLAVRNIDGFNARMAEARAKGEIITRQVQVGFDKESGEALYEEQEMDLSPLPYIVIIVDEMADLMMVAGKEIEGAIQRLAQMARAAGIHLVMATQRPSVDVITGTIKANFPTRISFQVTSKIDSRTILGEMGAETLLGQGDMLFMAGGGRIQRVHGPFVSDAEVEHVVSFLKTQGGPEYLDEVVTDEEADGPSDGEDTAVFDKGALGEGSGDLYDQAVAIVMRDRKASTSYIQRRLQVGYNKAASLMERMENEGIVGPANHAGKREILAFSRGD